MANSTLRRAIIRTTWLRGGNYGGILQAYALQVVLRDLGFDAVTDESMPTTGPKEALVRLAQYPLAVFDKLPLSDGGALRKSRSGLDPFIDSKINTVSLYRFRHSPSRTKLRGVDAYVVGSDQVWRPNPWLESFFLNFLREDARALRVAYGVSFGVDEFSSADRDRLVRMGPLVRRFRAISVRERSGVDLCQNLWGVRAQWVIDPVLLLPASHYRAMVDRTPVKSVAPRLLSYVLDDSKTKGSLVTEMASRLAMGLTVAVPPEVPSLHEYRLRPEYWNRPSMESWVGQFLDHDFVVTDSFHGVVLSLLFHKPFIAIGNPCRGLARFTSLLGAVGLDSRLMSEADSLPDLSEPIPWGKVQDAIDMHRSRGWDFLRSSLSLG